MLTFCLYFIHQPHSGQIGLPLITGPGWKHPYIMFFGRGGLFTGLGIRMAGALPSAAIFMPLFEFVRTRLGAMDSSLLGAQPLLD